MVRIHNFEQRYLAGKLTLELNSRFCGVSAQEQMCGDDPSPKKLAALDGCDRVQNQQDWKRRVGYEGVFSSLNHEAVHF